MIRDYSRNSLAVREQREENVYLYLKGKGLRQGFGVTFIGIFINLLSAIPS
jgi:hypothetical protein